MLIDADNAPAPKIDFVIAELATYGVVNIRRAYGNWKKASLGGWEKVLHEYAIQPVQHFDIVKGKNASDMALLIEAMDILYTKSLGTFCLVSSDCDFTPLVLRLRADGKQVIGFGNSKAPAPFVASCTRFLYLDDASKAKATMGGQRSARWERIYKIRDPSIRETTDFPSSANSFPPSMRSRLRKQRMEIRIHIRYA